ncbi:hypothetical protein COXBURSA334_0629 [Coxiella burnetii Q321]|nr:hypothetical protein COXBURSA334_0629 [Coxiella burnetii Q321]
MLGQKRESPKTRRNNGSIHLKTRLIRIKPYFSIPFFER